MSNALIIPILIALAALFTESRSELVIKGQRVVVNGQTSLGGFKCTLKRESKSDTIEVKGGSGNGAPLLHLEIPIKEFGCGNFLLNRDFQKTLREEEFPVITVHINELVQVGDELLGDLELGVVGKVVVLEKVVFRQVSDKHGPKLTTDLQLNMADLELKPPRRLGGLITVDEQLGIAVDLLL